MPVSVPTLAPVSPGRPSPYESGIELPGPAPEQLFYVLLVSGIHGPVTSSELAVVAEAAYALTGATVTVTPA